jgi:hypothetical protein
MPPLHRAALVGVVILLVSACTERDLPSPASGEAVLLPVEIDGSWGYIDPDGNVIVEPRFEGAWRFSNDLALVKSGGRFGFIERDGRYAIEPRFEDAWHFSGGLAPVVLDSTWAFVDREGRVIEDTLYSIEPSTLVENQYDHSMLDLVSVDGRYGFAAADGRPVIDPTFESAWHFSSGLARVKSDGMWGYIDREGTVVVEPRFDLAWDFEHGVAMVEVDGQTAYIDRSGRYVWPSDE